MATPDLDQTLSLQAKMDDKITPALQKIDKGLKTTQQALRELEASLTQASEKVGGGAENMADRSNRATERLQEDLRKTGGAFQELGSTAKQSSEEVGGAIRNALYTKGSAQRLQELDKELGSLKNSLEGMANTNRGSSIRARKMQAIGQDTLNKRVIPAFQELHATLDQYPETLQEITGAEQERMGTMNRTLKGVSDRVSGFGDRIKAIGLGVEDFVAGIVTGVTGAAGMKLRGIQVGAARIGGAGAYQEGGLLVPDIMRASQASEDVWGDAYETLLDTSKVAHEMYPYMLSQMTNLSKVTGIATGYFAEMAVQMTEIAHLDTGKWNELSQKIHTFAVESRAGVQELSNVLSEAVDKMTRYNREQRAAYANAALAGAAAGADIGLGAQAGATLIEGIQNDPQWMARIQGLAGGDVRGDVMDPTKHLDLLARTYGGAGQFAMDRNMNMADPIARQAFNAIAGGPGMDADAVAKITEVMQDNNLRTQKEFREWFRQYQDMASGDQSDDYRKALGAIRGSAGEQFERQRAILESAGMEIGNQTIKAVEAGMEPTIAMTAKIVDSLSRIDRNSEQFWSKGIAFFSIGMNLVKALESVTSLIPGMGWLSKALSTPAGTVVGAAIGANVIGGAVAGNEAAKFKNATGKYSSAQDLEDPQFTSVESPFYMSPEGRRAAAQQKNVDTNRSAYEREVKQYQRELKNMMEGRGQDPGAAPVQAYTGIDRDSLVTDSMFSRNDERDKFIRELRKQKGVQSTRAENKAWAAERTSRLAEYDANTVGPPTRDFAKADREEAFERYRAIKARNLGVDASDKRAELTRTERVNLRGQLGDLRRQEEVYFEETGKRWSKEMRELYNSQYFPKDTAGDREAGWTFRQEYDLRMGHLRDSENEEDRKLYEKGLKGLKNPDAVMNIRPGFTTSAVEAPAMNEGILNMGRNIDTGQAQLQTQEKIANWSEKSAGYLAQIAAWATGEKDKHGNLKVDVKPKTGDDGDAANRVYYGRK